MPVSYESTASGRVFSVVIAAVGAEGLAVAAVFTPTDGNRNRLEEGDILMPAAEGEPILRIVRPRRNVVGPGYPARVEVVEGLAADPSG